MIGNLEALIEEALLDGTVCLDTETTGLSFKDRIFSIQLKTANHSVYINMNSFTSDPLISPEPRYIKKEVIDMLAPLTDEIDLTWYIQNATFDTVMLAKEGIHIHGDIHCTMAVGRLIRNDRMSYSIDAMAKRLQVGDKDDSVKEYIKKNKLYRQENGEKIPMYYMVPYDIIVPYGLRDVEITYKVGEIQSKYIYGCKDVKTAELYQQEKWFASTAHTLEFEGIPVDLEYCKRAFDHHNRELELAHMDFEKHTGKVFVDSAKSLGEIIPDEYAGVSKKGGKSFDKYALAKCPMPIARVVERIRDNQNLVKNFYGNILSKAVEGKIHPNVNRAMTVTARLSYSNPNLQNFPKDEDYAGKEYIARKVIVPPQNCELVAIDFDQQEFRILLDYAGETKLIEQINAGNVDIHQVTADAVGVSRKEAKAVGFGLLYGLGRNSLATNLGKSLKETQEIVDEFNGKLPKVMRLIEQIKHVAKIRGYIHNWAGRRYYLDDPRFSYRMVNYLIQGGCGDIMRIALTRCMEESDHINYTTGYMIRPMISVHDEIVFYKTLGSPDEHIRHMQNIMESVYTPQNGMKLTTSVERSSVSWGQCDMREWSYESKETQNQNNQEVG